MLIFEDPTVTVKCRTAIKELLFYFNLYLSVKLDSLSCLFTSTSFFTNKSKNINRWKSIQTKLM